MCNVGRWAAVLALVILMSGCGGSDEAADPSEPGVTTTIGDERQELRPTYPASGCCEQAGLVGGPNGLRLAGDPATGCVWFEGIGTEARVSTIWPEGFTVSFDPLRVYDLQGAVFAEEGQTYTGLGGAEATDPPDTCRQDDESVSVASWRMGGVDTEPGP